MKDFDLEKIKLEEITEKYYDVLSDTKLMIDRLPSIHKNNEYLLSSLLSQYSNKLRLMKEGIHKPYFARIDFNDEMEKQVYECYIGKVGITDFDNNIVTVDWRAPIASLYYDSNIGNASYQAPDGIINGELIIKRQIEIENSILKSIQDVDTVSNDELLKPYLGVNSDNRLKNIVSTIQTEQNEIIREKLNKNLVIQGVAGSGKTTVALHRIAYLVYNFQNNIKQDEYMVVGPNRLFLDYISNVLPDLDANSVKQLTFEDLVKVYINEDLNINSSEKQLIEVIENKLDTNIYKFKNSLLYKNLLDKYLIDLNNTVVPENDLEVKNIKILSRKQILNIYSGISNNDYPSISSKIERAILLISSHIEGDIKLINDLNLKILHINSSDRDFIKKEIRNNFKSSIRTHLSKILKRKTTLIYKEFISSIDSYSSSDQTPLINSLKKNTNDNFKKKSYDFEDLAAIAYIHYKIHGSGDYQNIRHLVIDEAQDFGDFNFYILNKMMSKSTFSIFGDIAQSIYSYRSIDSWNSVINDIFNNNIEFKTLSKSYRTTIEIMNEANHITNYLKLSAATPMIRNGSEVSYYKINDNDQYNYINNLLEEYKNLGYKSIAVICKDSKEALTLHEELLKQEITLKIMLDSNNDFSDGICITTSYLTKGLEFDAVIIADVSETIYSSNDENDMKLLYVAMTRALHKLDILYKNDLTVPLKNKHK